MLAKKNDPSIVTLFLIQIGVKIGVTKRGCNGLSYSMNYTTEHNKFDEVIDCGDFKLVIDNKALMVLIGT